MQRELKVYGMGQVAAELAEQGAPAFQAAPSMLSQLLKAKTAEREVGLVAYQLGAARSPIYWDLSGLDFAQNEVNEALVSRFHRCELRELVQNVVLFGEPGAGKTQLAMSMGVQAIGHHRRRERFFCKVKLVYALEMEKTGGKAGQMMHRLDCADMVVLDGPFYLPFNTSGGSLLSRLLSRPYERPSVLITTNLNFGDQASVFGDAKMSTSLQERLTHHCHVLATWQRQLPLQEQLGSTRNDQEVVRDQEVVHDASHRG